MEKGRFPIWVWLPLCLMMMVFGAWLMAASRGIHSGHSNMSMEIKTLNNAKQIGYACHLYAADHDGSYPESLNELFPDYLPNRAILTSPLEPGNPDPYIYKPGLKESSPAGTILLQLKFKSDRLVVHVDDSAEIMKTP
jgi:hypothetical protein